MEVAPEHLARPEQETVAARKKEAVELSIRTVGAGDFPLLAALERRCFSDPWTEGMFRGMMVPGRSRYYLAQAGPEEEPIAYAGLSWVLDEGNVDNIATLPEYRRRGVAETLLTVLEEFARTLDLAVLTLEVRAGNAPAIALYRKRGYRAVGRRKNYYEKPREDALLMTLALKGGSGP